MATAPKRGLTFTKFFTNGDPLAKVKYSNRSSRITEPDEESKGT